MILMTVGVCHASQFSNEARYRQGNSRILSGRSILDHAREEPLAYLRGPLRTEATFFYTRRGHSLVSSAVDKAIAPIDQPPDGSLGIRGD
jgi:hypothetical protein